ncbi:vWA domain-containing protein [Agromyces sp. ZXT2-6]|uniref:vWA domain-containing protein n=1 Tax=Agromyces sp. ZXT2-6 TaxID=3461153 RepID=UPI00405506EA
MFDATAGAGGGTLLRAESGAGDARPKAKPKQGTAATTFTDEQASLAMPEADAAVDPVARARARQIAARLSVRRPRRDATSRRGIGELGSLPYRGGSDEIDLDKTIEMLAERPVPEDEDIVVRDRIRTKRSVVLAVDVSGSMKGERVATAAATVGALAGELVHDDLAVIAFWSDAAILLNLGQPVKPIELLDTIMRIPAQGLTNVAFPLELAATQLARAPVRDARVVLLSDCVHNAGPDPRPFAARLPRLDVLLDSSGEKDVELGRDLARLGRGTLHVVDDFRAVAPAVSAMFGG